MHRSLPRIPRDTITYLYQLMEIMSIDGINSARGSELENESEDRESEQF